MALIVSAATGNFSAGATWVGGVVPGVGDEARASNGHTVTIDVDTTCDEVSNAGTGIFTLASGVTLTANVTSKSTTTNRNCLQFTAASPAQGFIVGNCTGGTVNDARGADNTSSGTLNITGICTGGSANNTAGARNASSGVLNITGNTIGGTAGSGAVGARNLLAGVLNITGNAIGGTGGTGPYGADNLADGTINIVGIATGGTVASASGMLNFAGGTINLARVKGTAYGPGNTSGLAPAVGALNNGLGIIQIEELEYGEYGMSPTSGTGLRLKKLSSNVAVFNYCDTAGAKTLIDATENAAMPAATDVRDGVSYASGALTGTCKVPAAASVGFGVQVDNTTGTAVLTPSALWNTLTNTLTSSGSIGERLKNCSTIDSTGGQLAALV